MMQEEVYIPACENSDLYCCHFCKEMKLTTCQDLSCLCGNDPDCCEMMERYDEDGNVVEPDMRG